MGKITKRLFDLAVGVLIIASGIKGYAVSNYDFGEIINTDFAQGKNCLCALRDTYGFLWVGTLTGLGCVDGNGRSVYPHSSDIMSATEGVNITSLFELEDDIWIGTDQGWLVFDRHANRVARSPYRTKYGVSVSSQVQKFMKVGDDRVWILTHGQGFFVFDKKEGVLLQNSRYGSFYTDMAVTDDGQVYAVTLDGYVQAFNPEGIFIGSERLPGYVADKSVLRMAVSGHDIRISFHGSIYRYDTEANTVILEKFGVVRGEINSMLAGSDGVILLGTDDGVWLYDTELKEAIRLTPPL